MPRNASPTTLTLNQIGAFCSEWTESTLQEACQLVTDGTHDSPKEASKGFPLVTGKCIKGGRLSVDAAYLISEADHKKVISRSRAIKGDLLFANIGNSAGEVCLINEKVDISIKNLALFRPSKKLDGIFLLAYLRSRRVQDYIRNTIIGSAQPFIGLGTLRGFPVPLPPITEQRAIAHILGTLDDKIELNRKTNETLEAMAKTLFKSWFVDFDPVRAKAEGRPTGLPAEISDLFPDSFEDSELGEIPKGWQVKTFEQVCKSIYSGGTPLTTEPNYWDGDLPWFSSGETRAPFVNRTEKTITSLGVKESSTRLASKCSTVIASAGQGHTRGQVSMLLLDSYVNQSVVVLEASKEISSEYFIFFDASRRYDEFRRVSDSSSSRGSLTTKILASLLTVDPPQEIHNLFRRMVETDIGKIGSNLDQTGVLTQARDALLPKLISGEIRIPDAEKMLEEVGV